MGRGAWRLQRLSARAILAQDMRSVPKTVAVIGGGPAGSSAAESLARGGVKAVVFEEKPGWEKPCGGGLSARALARYPFLAGRAEGQTVRQIELHGTDGANVRVALREPLAIWSRANLNTRLLDRACQAGASVIRDRVLRLRRRGDGWEIEGRERSYAADFVILAAGARTRLRGELAGHLRARDFMLTVGYYIPGHDSWVRIKFYRDFEGYAWAFPRPDHYSVGICGKVGEASMAEMRARLDAFVAEFGYKRGSAETYAHLLPALAPASWADLRLNGDGWALAGDAAGLVDPLTGEGIYYAMRSGELLAESLLAGAPHAYPVGVSSDFGRSLAAGSRLAHVFYQADFFGKNLSTRMLEFACVSRPFKDLTEDLLLGRQPYERLVNRLFAIVPVALPEIAWGALRKVLGDGNGSTNTGPMAAARA